ncbi:group 1 truncated hemoglobin [Catenovulum sp. 2E275]|uniref:group I truncated hemoglobin n=1 Tax=Catenovulum sp. 2E275 TaxID=2980497 RepID=UPI0021D12DF4|nr:group 1 truncated hemoglobin [Catenovulum sp. 2E275]MCU4677228.1 group 1 truncated hemoglobin [Catenovulum sp. 2E275]
MKLITFLLVLTLTACVNQTQKTLYEQLGGKDKITQIVENFIYEIEFNETIYEYFKETDIQRFHDKLIEHICVNTGGPCQYTGDTMAQVHAGMNINESDFNLTVDLLINAMTKADIPHPLQNKVLAVFAPMRKDMIYK